MSKRLGAEQPIRLREEAGLHDDTLHGKVVLRDPAGSPIAIGSVKDGEYRIRFPRLATFAFHLGADEMRAAPAPTTPLFCAYAAPR